MIQVSDFVFLTGCFDLGRGVNGGPRYVGSFREGAKVGRVAYRLELSTELGRIHDTGMCRS